MTARPSGHEVTTGSPVLASGLLGLIGRGVFCLLGLALEHLPDPLHPWEREVRALSALMAGWVGMNKLRWLRPHVGQKEGDSKEGAGKADYSPRRSRWALSEKTRRNHPGSLHSKTLPADSSTLLSKNLRQSSISSSKVSLGRYWEERKGSGC